MSVLYEIQHDNYLC